MKDLEILGLPTTDLEFYNVKDWSDFVLIQEHELYKENVDNDTITHIEIYYNIHDLPFPGDGTFSTTDNKLDDITLEEFLDRNVYNRYKYNKHIKVDKIINI